MDRFLLTIILFLLSVTCLDAQTPLKKTRLSAYTQRSSFYDKISRTLKYGTRDSIALKYHGRNGSYFDTKRLEYFQVYILGSGAFVPAKFYPDIPSYNADLPPLPNTLFHDWNSVKYDTLLHFERDSLHKPLLLKATIVKRYNKQDELRSGIFLEKGTGRSTVCSLAYNAEGRLAKLTTMNNWQRSKWDTLSPQVFLYDSSGKLVMDTSGNKYSERNIYHYNSKGDIDTISKSYLIQGKLTTGQRHTFSYDTSRNITSYLYEVASNGGLKGYCAEYYIYLPGTNQLAEKHVYSDDWGTGLVLVELEQRVSNAEGTADTIFLMDHYYYSRCRVVQYDSLHNPISIAFLTAFNRSFPLRWSGEAYERFYYESIPETDSLETNYNLIEKPRQPTVAIEQLPNDFVVYPNPTNGMITVATPATGNLVLLNALGERIIQFDLKPGTQQLQLPASLSKGIYYALVVFHEGSESKSIKLFYKD